MRRVGLATALIVITLGPVLGACHDQTGVAPPSRSSPPAVETGGQRASSTAPTETPSGAPSAASSSSAQSAGPVACGDVPVPATGGKAAVHADAGPGGPVPCADALRVLAAYFRDAPTMAEGSGGFLTVEGWECATASMGSATPGRTTCRDGDRSVHAQP
ncbi:hypothetical protein [Streptoalloteichus hindustanus]|uniref:Subtilisin inhibitor-like n=1 Tax=Streptoalloteichus hindustanus TaxID=2017 RepID=A0A1M4XK92_STRHI|nr:hypothetical protein [Streptoalloteichus hindustanus]SHE93683.1 hypothetical protein SAMN05444320_10225 [Streptoalloteichus hindustanus]